MTWNPNLSYGASGDWFGNRDYTGNLKEIWDQYGPGKERQQKLMQRRKDILSWMGTEEGKSKMRAHNQLGVDPRSDGTGGLGSIVASGDFTKTLMGTNMDPKEGGGSVSDESFNWFGGADLMHARASGRSWTDILGHLDANKGDLRHANVPGGGGLYDDVKTQANFEKQQKDLTGEWSDKLGTLEESMGTQFTDLSGAMETGMGGVSDAIKAQTASEEKYRADQSAWQRRQENMQQMMIQEGRRKAREKPVMAVMPGQGAYGGGAGGASSFARKKKQTTGLNIA